MILQSLVQYYEDLLRCGRIAAPGWGPQKISYVLELEPDGTLRQVVCIKTEVPSEKKTMLLPQEMKLPAAVKRSSNTNPNFLWDNATYILGIDKMMAEGDDTSGETKKKNAALRQRALNRFAASKARHIELIGNTDSPAARAITAFFENWDPSRAAEHPALPDDMEDILSGANLVFRVNGSYAQDDPAVRSAWQAAYSGGGGESREDKAFCLVTGQYAPTAVLHPSIKGVQGAQSSGASLVSFNAPAFCSYQHEQGRNAPTGEYAAFAYGAALNYLLADREYVNRIGDTTVLCWAAGGEPEYQGMINLCMFAQGYSNTKYTQEDVRSMVANLAAGRSVDFDGNRLNPEQPFFILGLAPNAARLSVRFFYRNTVGGLLQNLQRHFAQMEVIRPAYEKFDTVPLYFLLNETVNQNARDKKPAPGMSGEVLRAILNGTRYPATLRNGVQLRIRADKTINRTRVGIIKAYYLRCPTTEIPNPEEVFTVSLNRESTSIPYQLGRLFSVLEEIQENANPGINTTIRDKYFNSASATPATVFPTLVNLSMKHLRKIGGGASVNLSKKMQEVMDRLEDGYPPRLSLPEQGAFQIGYYHQRQDRFTKKEEKKSAAEKS